jgi:hypothetical protein
MRRPSCREGDDDVKLVKMLGLAGVTALAAMAFVGAGTASADSACLVDPGPKGKCPEGSIWTGPIIGLSPQAIFIMDEKTTTCKSEFLADYLENEGAHVGVLYLILTLVFRECVGACPEVFAENLPYLFLVLMNQTHAFLYEDPFFGQPAVLLKDCIILNQLMNCLYRLPVKTLLIYELEKNEKGEPLVGAFRVPFEPLTLAGDDEKICPKEARFEATYLIYEDKEKKEGPELFYTALP